MLLAPFCENGECCRLGKLALASLYSEVVHSGHWGSASVVDENDELTLAACTPLDLERGLEEGVS